MKHLVHPKRSLMLGAISLLALRNTAGGDGGGGGGAGADAAVAKAAADKAAADTAAAAAASQTPEQKAAAEKAAADKKAAQLTAIKNVLKLPEKSSIDAAVVERTAAIASELGLSPDHAPKILDLVHQEATTHADKTVVAALEAHQPGGAEWTKQQTQWQADALKDPDIGNGNPEQLKQVVDLGKRVLAKFGDAQTTEYLEKTGLGSHPAALKLFARLGRAMAEDKIIDAKGPPSTPKDPASVMYPNNVPKP